MRLSAPSGQIVRVNYASANGTATAGTDYVAKNGTLSFAPGGALTQTVSIVINGDTAIEGNREGVGLSCGARLSYQFKGAKPFLPREETASSFFGEDELKQLLQQKRRADQKF